MYIQSYASCLSTTFKSTLQKILLQKFNPFNVIEIILFYVYKYYYLNCLNGKYCC